MTSTAYIEKEDNSWVVMLDVGITIIKFGPYRWKWVANIVAWYFKDEH